ncbi:MAG: hypothetical protein AAB966_00875 [Patescibacteria group bacterium]
MEDFAIHVLFIVIFIQIIFLSIAFMALTKSVFLLHEDFKRAIDRELIV